MKTTRSAHPVHPKIGRIGVQTILAASIALAITFTLSCSSDSFKTVKIGKQVWMAENLNIDIQGSKCYGEGGKILVSGGDIFSGPAIYKKLSNAEIQANCKKYGRLYYYGIAMQACPKGWHLPSPEEWQMLVDFVGGDKVAVRKLKAKNGWNNDGNGTDDYGFSALPGGNGDSDGDFRDVGQHGYWWLSDLNLHWVIYNDYAFMRTSDKSDLFSVRCLQD